MKYAGIPVNTMVRPGHVCAHLDHGDADDVQNERHCTVECRVWSIRVGHFLRKRNRQKYKDRSRRDNMLEQVSVEVTVTGDLAGGIIFYCARQHQRRGLDSLNRQSPAGSISIIQHA